MIESIEYPETEKNYGVPHTLPKKFAAIIFKTKNKIT